MRRKQAFVTIAQAAELAGMRERTLRRRIVAGQIPTSKDPRDMRRKLILVADLRRYLGTVELPQIR